MALINSIKQVVADRCKVFHTTLQLKTGACAHTADGCNFIGWRKRPSPRR